MKLINKYLLPLKYIGVGFTGFVINLIIFKTLVYLFNISIFLSSAIAFSFAATSNYLLNHTLTFMVNGGLKTVSFKKYLTNILGNLVGLTINLLILYLVVKFLGFNFYLFGQIMGIFCGTSFNYFYTKVVVFSEQSKYQLWDK